MRSEILNMERHIWGTSACGCFEIISLSPERLDEAFTLIETSFIPHETICKAIGLDKEEASKKELVDLFLLIAKDGISLIIVEKKTDRIVSLILNKIWLKSEPEYFKRKTAHWKNRASKLFARFMVLGEGYIDTFKYSKTGCMFETIFGTVHPDFNGKKLGYLMIMGSLNLARALNKGINVRIALDDRKLELLSPDVVFAFCTSLKSRKFVLDCKFLEVETIPYVNYVMENNKTLDKMTEESYMSFLIYNL